MFSEMNAIRFGKFGEAEACDYREYFLLRPNRSCESVPLCQFLWRYYYPVDYAHVGDCLYFGVMGRSGAPSGSIPFCREEELPHYFRLEEQYFNEVLKAPLRIYYGDEKGMQYLREAGCLDNYSVEENTDIRDYLYDAEDLRTLAGRKYAKKRNHLKRFLTQYEGRWEYRSLGSRDRDEIIAFLNGWIAERLQREEKAADDAGNAEPDAEGELNAEEKGIVSVLSSTGIMDTIRVGGIYIDGALKAFSMGAYNELEKMAVIEVEKADPSVEGLYQAINKEFLCRAFPEAEIVNREDDVGLEGLRQAKMSYHPIDFARKYRIIQKDYDRIS